ncbi:MAG TPA: hypothetical protein VF997_23315 [Polyangia bacterium]
MIEIDEGAWPLVIFRFRGQASMEELNTYLARQDVLLARKEPMLSLVLAQEAKLWETPVLRRQADWIKQNQELLRRYSLGAALVIQSPIVRGMLKAILWIQPMPQPHAVFPTVEGALRWLREQVARAKLSIAVPERL